MRDHSKLRAFQLADSLAIAVYVETRSFPPEERFGLTAQLRRGAVAVASNIVEGCARTTTRDYVRFLVMAYAACCELEYQWSLAERLGYAPTDDPAGVGPRARETGKVLGALVRSLRASSRPGA